MPNLFGGGRNVAPLDMVLPDLVQHYVIAEAPANNKCVTPVSETTGARHMYICDN